MAEQTNETPYTPPTPEETIIRDFLCWASREHCAVLVNIQTEGKYKFLNMDGLVKEYLKDDE